MPSILLDHHIDEVAMRSTPDTTAHRWSRRRSRATVASVIAAAVHPPQRRDIPPVRPRAVAAEPLHCAPGTARAVLDELRAEHHFRPQDLVPLTQLATVPLPPADNPFAELTALLELSPVRTNWGYALHVTELHITARIDAELAAGPTRELDAVHNTWVFAAHQLTATVRAELDAIERDLVDACAEWILAEVNAR